MRTIGTIRHPQITVTVFGYNEKYIIKLEAGPMEQVFKLPMTDIDGMPTIEKLLDNEFMQKAMERFVEMAQSFKAARERMMGG
jgi:hypothetical protein